MYLLVAATEMELEPARQALAGAPDAAFLLCGVGPVDAAFALTRHLCRHARVAAVINFGLAGAYRDTGLGVLDLCLAESEVLADLGICLADRIEPLAGEALAVNREFDLESGLSRQARRILALENMAFACGAFLTVSCVSGTARRGDYLRQAHQAICENMEGAALARVCQGCGVDFLELRCVSNMVEDRDPARWRLKEACARAALAAATVVRGLNSAELSHKQETGVRSQNEKGRPQNQLF